MVLLASDVEKETTPEFVTIEFEPYTLHPDSREYRQQSVEFALNDLHSVKVAVKVPNLPLYVEQVHDEEWIIVLTPAGWFYVQQEMEKPYLNFIAQQKQSNIEQFENTKESTDESWDEEPTNTSKEPTPNKSSNGEESWDEEKDTNDW